MTIDIFLLFEHAFSFKNIFPFPVSMRQKLGYFFNEELAQSSVSDPDPVVSKIFPYVSIF
jgi:hypothetical protein